MSSQPEDLTESKNGKIKITSDNSETEEGVASLTNSEGGGSSREKEVAKVINQSEEDESGSTAEEAVGVISEDDEERDSTAAVGNQVVAQTARLFLRESFLRILWNLKGSPARISFLDRPDIIANFVAFNREFDEGVIETRKEESKDPKKQQEKPHREKIDLVSTTSISIDYQPKGKTYFLEKKNGESGADRKAD